MGTPRTSDNNAYDHCTFCSNQCARTYKNLTLGIPVGNKKLSNSLQENCRILMPPGEPRRVASNPNLEWGNKPPILADLCIKDSEVTQNCKFIYLPTFSIYKLRTAKSRPTR